MNATVAVDQTVVAQIAALLQGCSSEEIEAIFQEVRSQLATSVLPTLPATPTLEDLFDWQVKALVSKGFASEEQLEPLRPLLAKVATPTWTDGRIPFVIVPQTSLDLNERMRKVVLADKKGKNYLDPDKIINLYSVPTGHYLAVDVEDGRVMRKQAPCDCQKQFEKRGRFGLTVNEGATLVTYLPEILNHHFIDLPGSRYDEGVPSLYVLGDRPELDADWDGYVAPGYGSASCGSRLGLSDLEASEPLVP